MSAPLSVVAYGLACVDIVNTVPHYPAEDEEIRIKETHKCRGGNATNSLVVLGQLGARGTWAGTTSDPRIDHDAQFIQEDLRKYGVDPSRAVYVPGSRQLPTSYILLSEATGSRTIAHHRGPLPELTAPQFLSSLFPPEGLVTPDAIRQWNWYHFEGRNIEETVLSLRALREVRGPGEWSHFVGPARTGPCLSVEIEKTHAHTPLLFTQGDVLFLSKEYAAKHGFSDAEGILKHAAAAATPGALLVCAWGALGAWALDTTRISCPGGGLCHSPAFPPPGGIVDSIGAGDTFLAGMVFALGSGAAPPAALAFACALAGAKCGVSGFEVPGIPDLLASLPVPAPPPA